MYDIPADVLSLATNAGHKAGAGLPAGAKMLKNDAGFAGFLGAAPPVGHGDHRYMFVVSALGVDTLPIEAGTLTCTRHSRARSPACALSLLACVVVFRNSGVLTDRTHPAYRRTHCRRAPALRS